MTTVGALVPQFWAYPHLLEVQANEDDFDGEGMWLQGVFMLILNMFSQRKHPQKYRGSMFIPWKQRAMFTGLAILEVTAESQ